MPDHISATCRAGWFQLRQLHVVIWSQTLNAIVHLIMRRLLLTLIFHGVTVQRLNAAAWVATRAGTRRPYDIIPVLEELHWLPLRRRVNNGGPEFFASAIC